MQTRREFLGTLGIGALGAAALACTGTNGQASTPPTKVMPLGIQLYTLRSLLERDFDGTLARVAEIGYREVEFAGYYNRTPEQVREVLRRTGLAAPSAHIPLPATDDAWMRALDAAKIIGHQWAVVPWLDETQRKDLPRLADRLNHLAVMTKAAGLRQGYHNHDFEFAASPAGGTLLDALITGTDPALVSFEMDVYWVTKAGADPLALMAKYPGRFPLLHLKDATPAPERRITDVGSGTIDWRTVLRTARAQGHQHAFVEHDSSADPLASARTSFRYLSTLNA
jgi:sugar phosphate isomerase/epimerase